jgi:hypothetical protein
MIANQLDLSLPVAVCAWCKPEERGDGVGHLSHGICPGHLRKIKLELQGVSFKRRRRNRLASTEALLPF